MISHALPATRDLEPALTSSLADLSYDQAISILEKIAGAGRAEKSGLPLYLEIGPRAAPNPRTSENVSGLSASERRYRALVERIPAVTFVASLNENVHDLYISPQIETLLGFSQEEWLQDPFLWYRQLHPDDSAAWGNEFAATCLTGVNFRSEYRLLARDGHVVWIHGECQLITDSDGTPSYLLGIAFDITEQKRAEQQLRESHDALEQVVRSERAAHEALKQAQAALREMNQNLEARVMQRTAELETAHARLIQTARRAGMAEVASSVLHNVGNVLNSVNVRASLARDKVKHSRLDEFDHVCRLLDEHSQDLGEFLSSDARGRFVPDYIKKLTRRLSAERTAVMEDLDLLNVHVDQVKQLIDTQQTYARNEGLTEPTDIAHLVNDACTINHASLVKHEVTIEQYIPKLPVLLLDRHKIMQILINLISNAIHAVRAGQTGGGIERLVRIHVRLTTPGTLEFEVTDNGTGIRPENLTRIFSQGFTTRPGGHGLGLHGSANAAKEMGGSLIARSDGAGRGATFVLSLPYKIPANPINAMSVH